jgi:hypothetical protein
MIITHTLTPMTPDDAKSLDLPEADCHRYVRMDGGGAPPLWFRLVNVDVDGSEVEVAEPWTPPPIKIDPDSVTVALQRSLAGAVDNNVVISPLVWHPRDDGGQKWGFSVASAGAEGFRHDLLETRSRVEGEAARSAIIAAAKPPIVVHDMADELEAARLCEKLWPGERISGIRAAVEAERATIT